MNGNDLFDYKELKMDVERILEIIDTHVDNPWEREEILKTFQVLLQESKSLVESFSQDHSNLSDSLLFYQQSREQAHARAGRLKRLFSFGKSQEDVEEEAFQQALRETRQLRGELSMSQDSTVNAMTQMHTELAASLKNLLFHLIDQEGKELNKEILKKLGNRILGEEAD